MDPPRLGRRSARRRHTTCRQFHLGGSPSMSRIIYLIGLVVVIAIILSLLGLI
jgi:hypothetical protein